MKINKKDLASIIAEEATNAMLDEGFFDSIRNQINKLKAPPRDIEREGPTKASKAEEKIDDKKVIQNAGIIMANHGGDLKNSKAFKETPLFKKYIASEEKNLQEQTPFEKEFIGSLQKAVKQGQISAREIYDSIRSVYKSENSLRSAIKGASSDADETFGLSTIDRAETVGPGTKPEDMPLAADGDFEDFVSSTEKTQADSEEGEKTQVDSEEEVTDDQIELEAPADFKLAQELPATSGGIQGSTAPKPDEAPSSASQDSEESTAAARPSSKNAETEITADPTTIRREIEKAQNAKEIFKIAKKYGKGAINNDRDLRYFLKRRYTELGEAEQDLEQVNSPDDLEQYFLRHGDVVKDSEYLKDLYKRKDEEVRNVNESKRWKKLAGILKD